MPHFDYLILHGKGVHASHASLGPITFHLVKGKPLMLILTSCVVHVQPSLVYEYDVINIILMIFWNKWLPNACQIRLDVRKITVMLPLYILWHIQENFWHLGSISNETYFWTVACKILACTYSHFSWTFPNDYVIFNIIN